MSTLLATSKYLTVEVAVVAGISPSMAPSAALLGPLRVYSTLEHQVMLTTISTITAILKVTVTIFKKGMFEWDSGLEIVVDLIRSVTPSPDSMMR